MNATKFTNRILNRKMLSLFNDHYSSVETRFSNNVCPLKFRTYGVLVYGKLNIIHISITSDRL